MNHSDIDSPPLNASFEVKGLSNTDQLKFFDSQLDALLKELGFPFDNNFIWIVTYRNRANGERLLKRKAGKSWNTLSAFLAQKTYVAYLVDVRLAHLIRERNGLRAYKRDKWNPRWTVRCNRSGLKSLADNARESLEDLGFTPDDLSRWLPPGAKRLRARIIRTKFRRRQVSFELNLLVPNGFKNRFLRTLNGTVQQQLAS